MMELVKSPVTEREVRLATRTDPVLGGVLNRVLEGWGEAQEANESLKPFTTRSAELTTEGGCILWGCRVVIPLSLRSRVKKGHK